MIMGLDRQLIADGTYFVVEIRRPRRRLRRLEPAGHALRRRPHRRAATPPCWTPPPRPARVRAMYTHPDFARRGVGRLILGSARRPRRPRASPGWS